MTPAIRSFLATERGILFLRGSSRSAMRAIRPVGTGGYREGRLYFWGLIVAPERDGNVRPIEFV